MSRINKSRLVTDVQRLHRESKQCDMKDLRFLEVLSRALFEEYNLRECKMQGLSAIQVDYDYCAILLRYKKGDTPLIVFNPKVLKQFGKVKSNEGCMSEDNVRYIVERPLLCKVKYNLISGEEVTKWLTYKKARIFCHEVDHTLGILLQDKGTLA